MGMLRNGREVIMDEVTYQSGYFQSLGFVPATTTLITTSLSPGVGIGVSMISTASIELCIITCLLGMMVDSRA